MGMIINPFMVAAAVTSTTKVQVRIAEFDGDNECACSLTSTYEIWENDSTVNPNAGDLTLAVDDWLSGVDSSASTKCAQVTLLNQTGSAVGTTTTEYTDCADCNDNEAICDSESPGGGDPGGGDPGGPGGP